MYSYNVFLEIPILNELYSTGSEKLLFRERNKKLLLHLAKSAGTLVWMHYCALVEIQKKKLFKYESNNFQFQTTWKQIRGGRSYRKRNWKSFYSDFCILTTLNLKKIEQNENQQDTSFFNRQKLLPAKQKIKYFLTLPVGFSKSQLFFPS